MHFVSNPRIEVHSSVTRSAQAITKGYFLQHMGALWDLTGPTEQSGHHLRKPRQDDCDARFYGGNGAVQEWNADQ